MDSVFRGGEAWAPEEEELQTVHLKEGSGCAGLVLSRQVLAHPGHVALVFPVAKLAKDRRFILRLPLLYNGKVGPFRAPRALHCG